MTLHHLAGAVVLGAWLPVLGACSGEPKEPPTGAGGGFPPVDTCDLSFGNLADKPAVSFVDDVMPMFGLSCTANSCHSAEDRKGGLYLGPRCVFEKEVPWLCEYPAAPDPEKGTAPLTQAIIDEVYAGLLEKSHAAPGVSRIVPGDPENSFLVDKVGNTQNANRSYQATCQAEERGDELQGGGPCGGGMPRTDPWCAGEVDTSAATRFTAVAAWVKQGAPKE